MPHQALQARRTVVLPAHLPAVIIHFITAQVQPRVWEQLGHLLQHLLQRAQHTADKQQATQHD
jgi:hypothetical protein